jgi:hypothetical protein
MSGLHKAGNESGLTHASSVQAALDEIGNTGLAEFKNAYSFAKLPLFQAMSVLGL